MSGSGKTTAVRALEDAGWFCIDNLPAPLLMKVTELGETRDQLAFVVDVREQRFLKDVPQALEEARRAGHRVEVLFLDSSDEALARRYSETRRRHPLAGSGGVLEGIAKEREALRPLRDHAEHVLDTSSLTVHELRRQITARFGGGNNGLSLTVMSFGFKYGVPSNADMVLDVRFMPNPYFVPELKALTGKDPRVASFVLDRPDAWVFLDKTYELLEFLVPRYQKEGKSYVTVAIGCTGGKHRSVAVAHALTQRLKQSNFGGTAQLWDRDVDKE
ncbi:MAG: RNase adapter RapZ [Archangium gephyra]|uniref:RNase adapter RapZ n=1 Tax=Archangium gephyra TaxID=48 RepID=A0A2W5TSQ8_9BACT|nr:MAG: RNase adapter RapZ [Archangium gephyra]